MTKATLDSSNLEQAGREAFEAGQLAVSCPYTFINSPYWSTKDYSGFERDFHWRLNAWMKGWLDAQKEQKR